MSNKQTTPKTYRREEVLRHNTEEDCWVIIRNAVYDLTPFLKAHPGGKEILLSRAGEDASSYFHAKHGMSHAVQRQLEQYKIGELPEHERILADDRDEPFLQELLETIHRKKLYRRDRSFFSRISMIRTLNLLLFFTISIPAIYGLIPFWAAIPLVMIQAMVGTSMFGFIAHENTHGNFPGTPVGKFFLRISWPIIWPFISQNPLRYEHNSHHIKIGDPEYDYEVAAFSAIMRYSGKVRYRTFHRFQHFLARFMYPFYANYITTFGGITTGFWQKHNRHVALEHSLSVLWSLIWYIFLPGLITGIWLQPVLLYLLFQCTLFYGVYVGAAINHFVPASARPIPEQFQNIYGYYVCHHTTNFCSKSAFWYWYTGGFNLQIEHHLIPFVPVENLPDLVPEVRSLCQKYGYPYQDYPHFSELWKDHYSFLYMLSSPEGIEAEAMNKERYQAR